MDSQAHEAKIKGKEVWIKRKSTIKRKLKLKKLKIKIKIIMQIADQSQYNFK